MRGNVTISGYDDIGDNDGDKSMICWKIYICHQLAANVMQCKHALK